MLFKLAEPNMLQFCGVDKRSCTHFWDLLSRNGLGENLKNAAHNLYFSSMVSSLDDLYLNTNSVVFILAIESWTI